MEVFSYFQIEAVRYSVYWRNWLLRKQSLLRDAHPRCSPQGPLQEQTDNKLSTFCFWVSTLENEFSCTHPKTKQMAHAICLLLRKGGDLNVAQSVSYCASSPRECRCRACAVRKYTTEVTPKLRESPTVAIATTAWSAVFFIGSRWEFTHRPTTNKKTTDISRLLRERKGGDSNP